MWFCWHFFHTSAILFYFFAASIFAFHNFLVSCIKNDNKFTKITSSKAMKKLLSGEDKLIIQIDMTYYKLQPITTEYKLQLPGLSRAGQKPATYFYSLDTHGGFCSSLSFTESTEWCIQLTVVCSLITGITWYDYLLLLLLLS